jgi:hypothetical protein
MLNLNFVLLPKVQMILSTIIIVLCCVMLFLLFIETEKNQQFEEIRKSVTNLFDHVKKVTKKFSQTTTRRIVSFASSVKVFKIFIYIKYKGPFRYYLKLYQDILDPVTFGETQLKLMGMSRDTFCQSLFLQCYFWCYFVDPPPPSRMLHVI